MPLQNVDVLKPILTFLCRSIFTFKRENLRRFAHTRAHTHTHTHTEKDTFDIGLHCGIMNRLNIHIQGREP